MTRSLLASIRRGMTWALALGLVAGLGAWALEGRLPRNLAGDFICFWSAARIMVSGGNPYAAAAQMPVQQALGWDRTTDGDGVYEYMPYLYPPWLALLFVPLLPLGYSAAKALWLVVDAEAIFLAGWVLARTAPGVPRSIALVGVPVFAFSVVAVLIGQVAPLLLLAVAVCWRLADQGRHGWAGAVLAWLTVKPQLTALAVGGMLLWAVRARQWKLIGGFAGGLLVLSLAGAAVIPGWPVEMLQAVRQTPLPTDRMPQSGTTWLCLLRVAGVSGTAQWLLYLAAAIPFTGWVASVAIRPCSAPGTMLGLGLLGAFFVAPYARVYDFPVLLVPVLILMGSRLPQRWGALLLVLLLLVPYIHILRFPVHAAEDNYVFFWLPALLAIAWMATAIRGRPAEDVPAVPGR